MSSDWPVCPHCNKIILMDDSDTHHHHTTYHGDEAPKPHDCSCGETIYLKEHVHRWWEAGRTPEEAEDR